MGRRSTSRAAGVLGALGALVAALLVVVASAGSVSALPGTCTHTFVGASGGSWDTSTNWSPVGVPDDPSEIACVQPNKVVVGPAVFAFVNQLHLDSGAVVDVPAGGELDFAGDTTAAQLSGPGRVDVHGDVVFVGSGMLKAGGRLNARSSGTIRIANDSLISADWGTATTIDAGGTLDLNGNGGYYQGTPVAGQPVSTLTVNGLLTKTSGSTTSVIDATYVQGPTGSVSVACCATLAVNGPQGIHGAVSPNMSLGTGACGPGTVTVCAGSENPLVDPSSVTLQVSSANGNPAQVAVQELSLPPATEDSRALGQDIYAHADGLIQDKTKPATITLRFSQADVMSTPLNEVQVGHISDAGVMLQTPDCNGPDLPAGANYCIVRPVTRTAQNTFVTIKTIETSRWRLRRTAPGENFAQTAPSVPQSFAAKPGDGSVVRLSWAAPANDGGAAVSSYNVLLDGKQVATSTGLSAAVANADVGAHTFEVVAVNTIGAGSKVGASLTLKKLSKPRGAKALRGAKGGKKTAGLKWKAPASAGGLQLKAYQVVVVNAHGKVVAKKKVRATKHRLMITFKTGGTYRFKVRAKNLDKYGPFSAWTSYVKPR
jgi:hypothetical protein